MNFNMNTPSKFINDKNEVFSFYIPHLSKKYTEQDIKDIFITADIGDVKRADFIEKTSDNKNNLYVSVFVHMNNVFNRKSNFVYRNWGFTLYINPSFTVS